MFLLLPWKVDVPQDRWPVVNWLIIVATIAVFCLQVSELVKYSADDPPSAYEPQQRPSAPRPPTPQPTRTPRKEVQKVPGITGKLMLQGWSLRGLFGHMWLHAGVFHLLGNMLFLWIFGNAVCAKVGNIRYLLLYVLFGVSAGVGHLLFDGRPAVGASGAINGVVGMYLVLFYENEITCYFVFWPVIVIYLYVRQFAVRSMWMILFWLGWDIVEAVNGGSGVANFAHLGGFAAGFGITLLMCKKGWITMEKYEKSLLQWWEQRRCGAAKSPVDADYVRLGLRTAEQENPAESPTPELKPIPLPVSDSDSTKGSLLIDGFIRTACACGGTVKVSRQYAGRTVRCPSCKQPVVIPRQTDSYGLAPPRRGNLIRFTCGCGRKLRVPAHYGGRTGKCPQCGMKLKIPSICP